MGNRKLSTGFAMKLNGSLKATAFALDSTSAKKYLRPGESGNAGKGVWMYEPFVGATAYFDKRRPSAWPQRPYGELNSKKKDLWEMGARSKTEGTGLVVTATLRFRALSCSKGAQLPS